MLVDARAGELPLPVAEIPLASLHLVRLVEIHPRLRHARREAMHFEPVLAIRWVIAGVGVEQARMLVANLLERREERVGNGYGSRLVHERRFSVGCCRDGSVRNSFASGQRLIIGSPTRTLHSR